MCGRFTQVFPLDWIEAWLDIDEVDPATASIASPRANVAPSQPVLVAIARAGRRVLSLAEWGFRAGGSGSRPAPRPINAREETVASSRLFAAAFSTGRCVVPASGFFEWAGGPGARRPFHFRAADPTDPLLRLAAIASEDARGRSLAIVTTRARGPVAEIHDRMPRLLAKAELATWLAADPRRARSILTRPSSVDLSRERVSTRVNDARAEGLDLLDPVPDDE